MARKSVIYISDASEVDKEKLIAFAACSVSIEKAKVLAKKLHQWKLLYFLALQSRDTALGLEALTLDITHLSDSLQIVRRELLSYLRSQAGGAVGSALLNWDIRKEIRYQHAHPATIHFLRRLPDVHHYYRVASPTSDFETPDNWRLLLALLSCDFETLELLAREGSAPARWLCCDRSVSTLESSEPYHCDPDWARETDSLDFEVQNLYDMLNECLPFKGRDATNFAKRIRSQEELDYIARKQLDIELVEQSYQDELDDRSSSDYG